MPFYTTIVTVGTSLKGNLEKFQKSDQLDNNLGDYFKQGNYAPIVSALTNLPVDEPLKEMSAELRSTISMIEAGIIEKGRLILLISDTTDGNHAGNILRPTFEHIGFKDVKVITISQLNDSSEESFKRQGLTNLIVTISNNVRNFGRENVCINNTGGYKAEIAFAGIMGQALGIPVYYQFENFVAMIELPPLPIALDTEVFANNINLFLHFTHDPSRLVRLTDEMAVLMKREPKLEQLFETIADNDVTYLSITAAGLVFLESCLSQLEDPSKLIDLENVPVCPTKPEDKNCHLGSHHGKDKLVLFAKKILRSEHVTMIPCSTDFDSHATDFASNIYCDNNKWYIVFTMIDTDRGFSLIAETTARNKAEAKLIATDITARYIR